MSALTLSVCTGWIANKTEASREVLGCENKNWPSELKLHPSPSINDAKNKNVTETTPWRTMLTMWNPVGNRPSAIQ